MNYSVKAFINTSLLQVIAKVFGAILSILLARFLGPEDFGYYGLLMAFISVLLIPITGMSTVIIREGSRDRSESEKLSSLNKWFNIRAFIYFIVVIFIASMLYFFYNEYLILISVSLILLLRSHLIKYSAIFNAKEMSGVSQLPQNVCLPVFGTLLLLGLNYLINDLDVNDVIYMHLCVVIISIFFTVSLFKKRLNFSINKSSKNNILWDKDALKFSAISFVGLAGNEASILFLGVLSDSTQAGYYRVAQQILAILSLGIYSVNVVFAPQISRAFINSNAKLNEVAKSAVRLSTLTTLPIIILVMIFSEEIVIALFGEKYAVSAGILLVLCIGQIINVLSGSVGLILNMTGHEKINLKIQAFTLFITVLAMIPLTYLFGSTGTAIGVSFNMCFWNIVMCIYINKKLNITTWIR